MAVIGAPFNPIKEIDTVLKGLGLIIYLIDFLMIMQLVLQNQWIVN